MQPLPKKIDSKFRFVLVASSRAEQLLRGARARVEMPGKKPTRVAQTEVLRELIAWDYGSAPVEEEAVAAEPEETVEEEVH